MRTAVIGTGFAARWLHLPAINALDGAVIVGGVDPTPERREQWSQLTNAPTFASTEELLSKTKPDLVVVASPPNDHASSCLQALAAGAHVICEKPFVETVEQADEILAAAASAGRQVAINQEFRYLPIFSALRDQLDSQALGRPVFAQCSQFMDLAPWEEAVPWRAQMTDRSLFEGGVHIVDLLYWLMGMPATVQATTSGGLDPQRDADAIHIVTLTYPSRAVGQITINRLSKTGTRYLDVRLDCERGALRASHGGRALLSLGMKRAHRPGVLLEVGLEGSAWSEQGTRRKSLGRSPRNASAKATTELYREAVAAMQKGQEPPISARQARETLRIIKASYESAKTGQTVSL